jgi:hypothetical protein
MFPIALTSGAVLEIKSFSRIVVGVIEQIFCSPGVGATKSGTPVVGGPLSSRRFYVRLRKNGRIDVFCCTDDIGKIGRCDSGDSKNSHYCASKFSSGPFISILVANLPPTNRGEYLATRDCGRIVGNRSAPLASPASARRSRFRVRPIGRTAISASDANATRVAVAAVIVTTDNHWQHVRLAADAHIGRSQDSVTPSLGMGGLYPYGYKQGEKD